MDYKFKLIADRIRATIDKAFVNDSDLARELGVTRQALQNWKEKDKIPIERIVSYCLNKKLDLEFFLVGEGGDKQHSGEEKHCRMEKYEFL